MCHFLARTAYLRYCVQLLKSQAGSSSLTYPTQTFDDQPPWKWTEAQTSVRASWFLHLFFDDRSRWSFHFWPYAPGNPATVGSNSLSLVFGSPSSLLKDTVNQRRISSSLHKQQPTDFLPIHGCHPSLLQAATTSGCCSINSFYVLELFCLRVLLQL